MSGMRSIALCVYPKTILVPESRDHFNRQSRKYGGTLERYGRRGEIIYQGQKSTQTSDEQITLENS